MGSSFRPIVLALVLLKAILHTSEAGTVALGGACTQTSDCDTGTTPDAVCDTARGEDVCKITGDSGDCGTVIDQCISGSTCSSSTCTCESATYVLSNGLCLSKIGVTCATTTDCDSSVSGTVCDTTLNAPLCKVGATGDCSNNNADCVQNAACSSTCSCSAGYTATSTKVCQKGLGDSCTVIGDCSAITSAVCTNSVCACPVTSTGTTGTFTCTANTIGSACTLGGGECGGITGAICDTSGTSPVCACPATHTGTTGGSTCTAKAVGATCTASGGECGAVSGGYCNTGASGGAVCACSAIYDVSGSACAAKSCTTGQTGVCDPLDSNSECSSSACVCKANYQIFNTGDSSKCAPAVGATCTASGGECSSMPGGYCNTAGNSPVCACVDIAPASGGVCAFTTCTSDTPCTTLDANAECVSGFCACKSGYTINSSGTGNECVAQNNGATVVASIAVLMTCLLRSLF